MLSSNLAFLGNLRWSFPVELNLITQKNSQSRAHLYMRERKRTLLCLPGDGPKLGLGPAVSLPRAKVPDEESPSSTLLGTVPPRFWEAEALWACRDQILSPYTDRCNICIRKFFRDHCQNVSSGYLWVVCSQEILIFFFMFIVILLLLLGKWSCFLGVIWKYFILKY